jgi:hypothetical protein
MLAVGSRGPRLKRVAAPFAAAWAFALATAQPPAGDLPEWPEDIGGLDPALATAALGRLGQPPREPLDQERAAEARYRAALLRLEPLPLRDESAARADLVAVATASASSVWAARARYALAWLREQRGEHERALAAYQRLVIDEPDGEVGLRARVGAARVLLRTGIAGRAARWLQEAMDGGVSAATGAGPWRELAVRALLREGGAGSERQDSWTRTATAVPSVVGLAALAGGGVILGDRRGGRVVELDGGGKPVETWELSDLQAVAVDPRGRRYAVADGFVHRLDDAGAITRIAAIGEFGAVSAVAVDSLRTFWLLDRKGHRIGRIDPGDRAPRTVWESRGERLVGLCWDHGRLVAGEPREHRVVALNPDGTREVLASEETLRPAAVAVDPSGRIAVLEAPGRALRFYTAAGLPAGSSSLGADADTRAVAVAVAADGAVHLFDEASQAWLRLP